MPGLIISAQPVLTIAGDIVVASRYILEFANGKNITARETHSSHRQLHSSCCTRRVDLVHNDLNQFRISYEAINKQKLYVIVFMSTST